jgi:hypothetical protein
MANKITGCDRANKMPKLKRTINVGIRVSGSGTGSARPASGQMFPRGK